MDELERDAVAPGSGLGPLELPSREAAHVEMVSVQARHNTVAVKFDLELQLARFTYRRISRISRRYLAAESAVGLSDGQPATPRIAGRAFSRRIDSSGMGSDSTPSSK